jgi:hypothetical protein
MLSAIGADNFTFRNNVIEDTEGTTAGWFIGNGSGTKADDNTATGWKIYGNLIRSTSNGGTISYGVIYVANDTGAGTSYGNENWMDDCYFANNTIVNLNLDWDMMIRHDSSGGSGNVCINNVYYNNTQSAGAGDTAFQNAGTLSYNWYFDTASTGDSGTGKTTCSSSCSALFADAANLHMQLVSTLAGTSLAAEYNTDILGNTRGSDGTWDRGAFELVAPPPDSTPPSITITSPTSSPTYSTNVTTIDISGTASDETGISGAITWSNDRGGSGNCTGTTTWSKMGITLAEGYNVITVTVTDGINTTQDIITVLYAPPIAGSTWTVDVIYVNPP